MSGRVRFRSACLLACVLLLTACGGASADGRIEVPDVVGESVEYARGALAAVGLVADVVETGAGGVPGQVTAQVPAPGTEVAAGSPVVIKVPTSTTTATVPVATTDTSGPEVISTTPVARWFTTDGSKPTLFPDSIASFGFGHINGPADVVAELGAHTSTGQSEDFVYYNWDIGGSGRLSVSDNGQDVSAECDPDGPVRIALHGGLVLCGSTVAEVLALWGYPTAAADAPTASPWSWDDYWTCDGGELNMVRIWAGEQPIADADPGAVVDQVAIFQYSPSSCPGATPAENPTTTLASFATQFGGPFFSYDGTNPTASPDTFTAVGFMTLGDTALDVEVLVETPGDTITSPVIGTRHRWEVSGPAWIEVWEDGDLVASCDPEGQTRIALFGGLTLCGSTYGELVEAWGEPDQGQDGRMSAARYRGSLGGRDWLIMIDVAEYRDDWPLGGNSLYHGTFPEDDALGPEFRLLNQIVTQIYVAWND